MSGVLEKMDKQFHYQQTLFATTSNLDDLFVSVEHLSAYLAQQMRAEPRITRRQVKVELERLADAGKIRRWTEVYGQSLRPDRDDHYFLHAGQTEERS